MSTQERIRQVLLDLQGTPEFPGPIGELGLIIEDVAVTPAGKRRLVRIWLDRDLAGLDVDDQTSVVEPLSLDEVADATRAISVALDESDAAGEMPYVLEVGSAGVDRPLTTPRHFRRNVTRLVEIHRVRGSEDTQNPEGTPSAGDADSASVTGRLIAAGPTHATVLVAATKHEPQNELLIPYGDISRAQVQVEFSRPTTDEDS